MSAVLTRTARPASPADVVALQYGNPNRMIGVPLYILSAVILLSIAISVIILRSGGTLEGSDYNASVLYSVLGYTVAIGVQNVSTSFPFSLALGSTRRTFVLGNLITSLAQGLLVSIASVVLLGLELATGGWFIGAKVMSSVLLGAGNPLVLGGVMLLAMLCALSAGGVFGAAWVRFGARGPLVLSLGITATVVLLLLLLLPQAPAIAAAAQPWWVAAAGAIEIGLAVVAQYLFLRRASVR
jgi:hypothetical protein